MPNISTFLPIYVQGVEIKGKGLLNTFIWDGELSLNDKLEDNHDAVSLEYLLLGPAAGKRGSSIKLPSPAGGQDRPLPMPTAGDAVMAEDGVAAAPPCLPTHVSSGTCSGGGTRSRLVLDRRWGRGAAEGDANISAPLFFCDTMVVNDGDSPESSSRIVLPLGISVSGSAALACILLAGRSTGRNTTDAHDQQPSLAVGGWPMHH